MHTGGLPSSEMISEMNPRSGVSRAVEAWKSLMIWVMGRPSVFSELGGRPWSELLKGRDFRWIWWGGEGPLAMAERR